MSERPGVQSAPGRTRTSPFDTPSDAGQILKHQRVSQLDCTDKLLGKLVEDRGVDDMVVTLADCLQDYLRTGISEEVVREQIRLYSES